MHACLECSGPVDAHNRSFDITTKNGRLEKIVHYRCEHCGGFEVVLVSRDGIWEESSVTRSDWVPAPIAEMRKVTHDIDIADDYEPDAERQFEAGELQIAGCPVPDLSN